MNILQTLSLGMLLLTQSYGASTPLNHTSDTTDCIHYIFNTHVHKYDDVKALIKEFQIENTSNKVTRVEYLEVLTTLNNQYTKYQSIQNTKKDILNQQTYNQDKTSKTYHMDKFCEELISALESKDLFRFFIENVEANFKNTLDKDYDKRIEGYVLSTRSYIVLQQISSFYRYQSIKKYADKQLKQNLYKDFLTYTANTLGENIDDILEKPKPKIEI